MKSRDTTTGGDAACSGRVPSVEDTTKSENAPVSNAAPKFNPSVAAIEAAEKICRETLREQANNPAWSKAELWGIERDILPMLRIRIRAAIDEAYEKGRSDERRQEISQARTWRDHKAEDAIEAHKIKAEDTPA